MNVERGDVVLADMPFSDRTGSKKRPALVVQCDRNNRRLDNVIFALITTVTSRATSEPTQLLIEANTVSGRATGLLFDSTVKCEHLVTLHRRFVGRVIGHLSDESIEKVNFCLKESLELD